MVTPSCALTPPTAPTPPRPHTLSRSSSYRGPHSTVLSIPLKTGLLFITGSICRPAVCPHPQPQAGLWNNSARGWISQEPCRGHYAHCSHGLFCNFTTQLPNDRSCPSLITLQLCLWSSWQGLCWGPGLCQWRDGMVSFSMGMNSFSQAPGWVGCALGAMSQSFLVQ